MEDYSLGMVLQQFRSDPSMSPAAAPPPLEDTALQAARLQDMAGQALHRATMAMQADFARRTTGFDLSPSQFALLTLIEANPGVTAGDLARASGLDKSTLTPFLAKLQARGLITRQRSVIDRRVQHIEMTDYGQRFLGDLTDLVLAQEARFAARMGSEKLAQLLSLLARAEAILNDPD